MVMVIRDGCHEAIPITARLDGKAEFGGGAMTRTSLLSYNGCDWTRTLLWLDGDCVIVIDTLTAHTAADYELRCYWRTLADTELTDTGMHTVSHFSFVHIADVDGDGKLEVITVASDTLVHCIDHLGEKKWTRSIGDDPAGLVTMGEGIAAASKTGDVRLIDGQGKLLWRTWLGSPCTALARAGNLLAVAVESGWFVWLQGAGHSRGP